MADDDVGVRNLVFDGFEGTAAGERTNRVVTRHTSDTVVTLLHTLVHVYKSKHPIKIQNHFIML